MAAFGNQLNKSFRRLRSAPLFTAITLITLAAGVGAKHRRFQRPRRHPG